VDPGRLEVDPSSDRSGPQRIPRPPGSLPGAVAPWAGHSVGAVSVDDVRWAMAHSAPPTAPGAPVGAPLTEWPTGDPRPAAVLCAVFDEEGQARVVLTRRSSRLRSHTGEVSFPGGRLEAGEDLAAAALREAHEEVGIDPSTVEVIGRLSPLWTAIEPAPIQPFVGVLATPPALRPNPTEVERAFTVPLAELFAPGVGTEELWPLPGDEARPIHLFALVGDTVWGATARMLRELMERLWNTRPSLR